MEPGAALLRGAQSFESRAGVVEDEQEGLWSSKTSRMVAELLQQGKSVKEIAQDLFLTEKTVQTYTPYTRGMYGVATEDAQYSQDYRERMQTAAENMHQKSSGRPLVTTAGIRQQSAELHRIITLRGKIILWT